MRVISVSDTHNQHDKLVIPPCDLFLHCGDFSLRGTLAELLAFNKWLGTIPAKNILVVPGNHDFIVEQQPVLARQELTNGTFLIDEKVDIDGIKIYGSPWTPQYGNWAFMLPSVDLARKWANIPNDLDILVTHGPPQSILDKTSRGVDAGCLGLYFSIMRATPKYHFFGHIHESHGHHKAEHTEHYNVASLDGDYTVRDKPITEINIF